MECGESNRALLAHVQAHIRESEHTLKHSHTHTHTHTYIHRQPTKVPAAYPYGEDGNEVVPFLAGQEIDWSIKGQ